LFRDKEVFQRYANNAIKYINLKHVKKRINLWEL